jgi:hypothetical protein
MAKQKPASEKTPTPKSGSATNGAKNPHAVALGRLGGKKGGKARAKSMTAEERKASAKKAAEKRWEREGEDPIQIARRVMDEFLKKTNQ